MCDTNLYFCERFEMTDSQYVFSLNERNYFCLFNRNQQTAMKMSFKQEMQKLERTLCDINELRSPSQKLFQPEVSNVRQNNKTSVNGN